MTPPEKGTVERLFLGWFQADSRGMDKTESTQGHRSLPKSVRAKQAAELLGIGRSTFWRYAGSPDFPKARRLSPRCTVFDTDELLAWRDTKMA